MNATAKGLSKNTYLLFGLVVAVAYFFQLRLMLRYDANPDELLHLEITSYQSLRDILHYSLYETHPPLGYLLRYLWREIGNIWGVGNDLLFQRHLGVVFHAATAFILMRILANAGHARYALFGAALWLFMHEPLVMSVVVRQYVIANFFLVASIYYFQRYVRSGHTGSYLPFAACALAAQMTHYYSIIVYVFLFAAHFYRYQYDPKVKSISLRHAACGITMTAATLAWIALSRPYIGGYLGTKSGGLVDANNFLLPVYLQYIVPIFAAGGRSAEWWMRSSLPGVAVFFPVAFLLILYKALQRSKGEKIFFVAFVLLLLDVTVLAMGDIIPIMPLRRVYFFSFLAWMIIVRLAQECTWPLKNGKAIAAGLVVAYILGVQLFHLSGKEYNDPAEFSHTPQDTQAFRNQVEATPRNTRLFVTDLYTSSILAQGRQQLYRAREASPGAIVPLNFPAENPIVFSAADWNVASPETFKQLAHAYPHAAIISVLYHRWSTMVMLPKQLYDCAQSHPFPHDVIPSEIDGKPAFYILDLPRSMILNGTLERDCLSAKRG